MMYGVPILLHCHTNHSDGDFTPQQLVQAAKEAGYQGMTLTDHNTCSGYEVISQTTDFPALRSMEWTTYYGHMLVHGIKKIVDWRDATIDNIDTKIDEVWEDGGVVGIAHPFDPGSPICTGCHWDFDVKNWHHIHYIEIWNGEFPELSPFSERAYAFWKEKLMTGAPIFPAAGRDWHRSFQKRSRPAVNFLGIKGKVTPNKIHEALIARHTLCSLAPGVNLQILANGRPIEPGDRFGCTERIVIDVSTAPTNLPAFAKAQYHVDQWKLLSNEKIIAEACQNQEGSDDLSFHYEGVVPEGLLRLEACGTVDNGPLTPLVLCAPLQVLPTPRCQ